MKALIYKEFKLAMHPICYVFIFLFPLLILIPSYPLAIGFIYVLTCYPILFLGANKGQQSNDLLYSVLLPIRKKDVVLVRIFTVLFMQIVFMVMMSLLFPLTLYINKIILEANEIAKASGEIVEDVIIPGLGLNSFVLILAIAIIGFAISDLIFFPIYYRKGKSIVMSTLFTIIGFIIFIGVFTIALPYIPGLEFTNNLHLLIQFIILLVAILISAFLHLLTYKISYKELEKVDF